MKSLVKMTREEKNNFQPQPSVVDRRYEKCSHVEIVDRLPPPTVVDTRKSVEDARAKGVEQELPIQHGAASSAPVIAALGKGARGKKRPRSTNDVVGGPSQE